MVLKKFLNNGPKGLTVMVLKKFLNDETKKAPQ